MSTNTRRRVKIPTHAPEFYQALIALDEVSALGLDPKLAHLVRIRASQLNGCAYCLDMHTLDALHEGDTAQRVNVVATWHEAPKFYTEQEQAALALTEAITLISVDHVPDDVYEIAANAFDEKELAQLIGLIIMINAWNRVGVTCRIEPGHYNPS
ncbi:carboxymuconolactone decarboxylase family protein [Streptomyces sp. SID13031]|uniref:carboxymuconolactone decarboxylase family protein n=1 Tax=Streptomyces sp. SID13031 TaxID=2706046 RepID=UPI0013C90BB3|nr:carboxymuconolactone decarboxylase family protein [Streptomyces sp. SID13031]NEA34698.1 carboxymuconolactone decarboxylase family protein [Streptomyces sp. SID13031]